MSVLCGVSECVGGPTHLVRVSPFAECWADRHSAKAFVFFKKFFADCHFLALGKGPLCRVPGAALSNFFLPYYFFAALIYYLKLHVQIWDNFDFFLLYFVSFFVSLNFMEYFKFELQVHGIIEFDRSKK